MLIEIAPLLRGAAVVGAGFLAGGLNVVVGAGTLASFPILVLLGFPPLTATMANTIGIVPGSLSGVLVYRRELRAHYRVTGLLLPSSSAGGVTGALLLLHLSVDIFAAVIPWLIGIGTLLVLSGPAIKNRIGRVAATDDVDATPFPRRGSKVASVVGAFLLGVYGGYFSAAQGILLVALLGITTTLLMQELNAVKNASVAAVNIIAATVFIFVSPELISWPIVALVALGSILGGLVGGRFARRLPAGLFRGFVVIVGITTVTAIVLSH